MNGLTEKTCRCGSFLSATRKRGDAGVEPVIRSTPTSSRRRNLRVQEEKQLEAGGTGPASKTPGQLFA
jgi:hypothetical protein